MALTDRSPSISPSIIAFLLARTDAKPCIKVLLFDSIDCFPFGAAGAFFIVVFIMGGGGGGGGAFPGIPGSPGIPCGGGIPGSPGIPGIPGNGGGGGAVPVGIGGGGGANMGAGYDLSGGGKRLGGPLVTLLVSP